jgi:hypothetical protein
MSRGIESERHRFSNISRQCWRNVAEPVEMNAVAVNSAALRHLDQKQIQLFERLGHAGQKSVRFPTFGRRCFRLGTFAAVVKRRVKRCVTRSPARSRWASVYRAPSLPLARSHPARTGNMSSTVEKTRSIRPRPRGCPCIEKTNCILRSAPTCSR